MATICIAVGMGFMEIEVGGELPSETYEPKENEIQIEVAVKEKEALVA